MGTVSDDMRKDSIRTFHKRKRHEVENGVQIFWLTTAGIL